MIKNLSIKIKIALVMAIGILLNTLIIGIISYQSSRDSLEEAYFSQLVSVREIKKRNIEGYFNQIKSQVITFSQDKMIVDAMKSFDNSFHEKNFNTSGENYQERESSVKRYFQSEFMSRNNNQGNIAQYMSNDPNSIYYQSQYISNNSFPVGSKNNLDRAEERNNYNAIHEKYHPVINDYLKEFNFYDIFLVDPTSGDIVYSVFKEVDYGTSLTNGPFNNSGIAEAYNKSVNANSENFTFLSDFARYSPSYGAPAGFISSPIFDGVKLIGVLIFQLPVDEINNKMTGENNWESDGLGGSGESYIVGADLTMKSMSRSLIQDPDSYFEELGKAGVDKKTIEEIKQAGTSILFQKVDTEGSRAAIAGQSDLKIIKDYRGISVLSAFAPLDIDGLEWVIMAEIDEAEAFAPIVVLRNTMLITALIVLAIALFISILVATTMARPIIKLAEALGLVSQGDLTIQIDSRSDDEIGNATSSMNAMITKLKEVIGGVTAAAGQITSASTEMNESSQQMSQGSSEQASSAEQVSSSMEEMASNIQQNNDNSRQTEKIATKAAEDISESNESVKTTVEKMKTIANKISIIGEISRQTNLLALNAAVEAARAGEHGKGFAVVAAEVRKLAERSQQAASEIDELSINSVDVAETSGNMLTGIVPDIKKTADLVQEITASNIEMSNGAEQINSAIQQLNTVTQQNAASAEEIAATSEELNSQAENLVGMIGFFNIGDDIKINRSNGSNGLEKKKKNELITPTELNIPTTQNGNGTNGTNGANGANINLGSSNNKLDDQYENF